MVVDFLRFRCNISPATNYDFAYIVAGGQPGMFFPKADELMDSSETDLKDAFLTTLNLLHSELLRRNLAKSQKVIAPQVHMRYYRVRAAKKNRKTKSEI